MTPGRSRRVALGFVFLAGSAAAVAFWWLTRFGAPPPGTGLGREVFLGKGRCATCHTLGAGAPPGRGPDLAGVGGRAATRVAGLDAAGYLLESLVQPNAFTVPGYPAELMPATHADPARLTPTEVRALVLFLMTLGGTPDRKALAAAEKRRPIPASDADAPAEKK